MTSKHQQSQIFVPLNIWALFYLTVCHFQPTAAQSSFFQVPSPWTWTCNSEKLCVRAEAATTQMGMSHAACKMTCYDSGVIWPKPTTTPILSKKLTPFRADRVKITNINANSPQVEDMLNEAGDIFLNLTRSMELNGLDESNGAVVGSCSAGTCGAVPYDAANHQFNVEISVTMDDVHIKMYTDESYSLSVETKETEKITTAYIVAPTFFGARHALETLSQLMTWDDLINSLVVIQDATINDSPVFTHRGLLIDTSRNYIEVPLLKRIIEGLSYNKMNVLHWHITDSQSFPFVSNREPLMAIYGAYSPRKVYRPQDVQELVHYAQVRGVKLIPEIDGPAHVGAGWDWGPRYGMGDLSLCFGQEPWREYCAEPPCGILNPINDNVYRVLNNIYKDLSEVFQSDVFHIGGDEVNFRCWNETEAIVAFMSERGWDRTTEGFLNLWSYYQNKSLEELDKAYGKKQDVLFWASTLTAEGRAPLYLDPKRYVIQFWENRDDPSTKALIEQTYRLIMSNSDALYLDCGYSAWVGDELNNWCSPYKGWQLIYENSPRKIVEDFGLDYANHVDQFIGGEAALWTEQAQGISIEGKLFPRTSALAERLWSDPNTGWKNAEPRMRTQRNRMVERGIAADAIQPLFCDQEDPGCY